MEERLSWDEYYMGLAIMASLRSPVQTTKVGAVLVNRHNQLISSGYNGPLPGFPHFRVNGDESMEQHAERNAVAAAASFNGGCEGGTLYCTHTPCIECVKDVLSARIRRVVFFAEEAKNKVANPSGLDLLRKASEQGLVSFTSLHPHPLYQKILVYFHTQVFGVEFDEEAKEV